MNSFNYYEARKRRKFILDSKRGKKSVHVNSYFGNESSDVSCGMSNHLSYPVTTPMIGQLLDYNIIHLAQSFPMSFIPISEFCFFFICDFYIFYYLLV